MKLARRLADWRQDNKAGLQSTCLGDMQNNRQLIKMCDLVEWEPEFASACREGDVEEEDGVAPIMESALPFDRQSKQLYPVSITWQPPFTMLLDLKGHGDLQVGSFNHLR